jgi:hypothetical protein
MSTINLPDNATEQQERNYIDFETKKFLHRLNKLNLKCKHVRVKDVKILFEHPTPVKAKLWFQFWKK